LIASPTFGTGAKFRLFSDLPENGNAAFAGVFSHTVA